MLYWKIPKEWGLIKLGEIAPEDTNVVTPKRRPTETFNYWGLDAISQDQFDEPLPNWVIGSSISSTCVSFSPQHVLYAKLRPYLNKVIVPSVNGIGSTEWVVLAPNPRRIERRYLAYALRTKSFVEQMTVSSTGARMPRARKDVLFASDIPVPYPDDPSRSLETQRRIVTRLEALLAEVAEARKLQEMIVEDTGHILKAILQEVYGQLSKDYPPEALGNKTLATIIAGQHIISQFHSEQPIGTPYITGPADFGDKYPLITKWTARPLVICEPGDILFTVKGSGVGKVNCAPLDHPTCISRQIMAIRPNTWKLDTNYLYYALLGRYDEFQHLRQGAAIPGIRKEQVEAIEIPLPPILKQKEITTYLQAVNEELQEMIRVQKSNAQMLRQLEQSFLAQVFRGEL